MKIAVLAKDPARGGAARAMRRLIAGLRARGHHVDLFCLDHDTDPKGSIAVQSPPNPDAEAADWFFTDAYVGRRRTERSNTLFTAQAVGYALHDAAELRRYDVLNVHWVADFLSAEGLAELARLGPPLVFTLHDMAVFTGGCHYSAGCEGYAGTCAACPQLRDDPLTVTERALAVKRAGLARPSVAAASPSVWLADEARRSNVFAEDAVHVLFNAIETDVFRPLDRAAARTAVGLPVEDRVLLFGAYHAGERRKGFEHLRTMLSYLGQDERGRRLLERKQIVVATFGLAAADLAVPGIRLHDLGYIGDDRQLAGAYAAADAVVLPSLEDNQPNIMLEAMACGTPVVAFAVGGIPDVVVDGVNGRLAPPFDVAALTRGLLDIIADPDPKWGVEARRRIEARHTLDHQAAGYEALFHELATAGGWQAEDGETPKAISTNRSIDSAYSAGPAGFLFRLLREQGNLAGLPRRIDEALAAVRGSGVRRLLGRPRLADLPADGAPAEVRLAGLIAALTSTWWEIGAPLRLLGRFHRRIRRTRR